MFAVLGFLKRSRLAEQWELTQFARLQEEALPREHGEMKRGRAGGYSVSSVCRDRRETGRTQMRRNKCQERPSFKRERDVPRENSRSSAARIDLSSLRIFSSLPVLFCARSLLLVRNGRNIRNSGSFRYSKRAPRESDSALCAAVVRS